LSRRTRLSVGGAGGRRGGWRAPDPQLWRDAGGVTAAEACARGRNGASRFLVPRMCRDVAPVGVSRRNQMGPTQLESSGIHGGPASTTLNSDLADPGSIPGASTSGRCHFPLRRSSDLTGIRSADSSSVAIPGASTTERAWLMRDERIAKLHVALVSRELASGEVRSSGPPHGACSRGTV
jgi:hypothetical protein